MNKSTMCIPQNNSKQIVDDIVRIVIVPIDASSKNQTTTIASNADDSLDIFGATMKRQRSLSEYESFSAELKDGAPHHRQCRRRLSSIKSSNNKNYSFGSKARHILSHAKDILDEIDTEDAIDRQQQQEQENEEEGENKARQSKPAASRFCWAGKKESHFFAFGNLLDDDDDDDDSDDESCHNMS